MTVGDVVLAARVAAGLFVIVAPTLLFLALWRGLQAMKDDELVQRVQQRADGMDQARSPLTAPVPSSPSTVPCPHCGTGNRRDVSYCRGCLASLE